jgi:hypothetical protein
MGTGIAAAAVSVVTPGAHHSEIRGIVRETIRLDDKILTGGDDEEALGHDALYLAQQV